MAYTKNLPTLKEWELIQSAVEKNRSKILLLKETSWHNARTRIKQTVTDIPCFAISNSSNRFKVITRIYEYRCTTEEEYNALNLGTPENWTENQIYRTNIWRFNEYYSHINIASEEEQYNIIISRNEKDQVTHYIVLHFQSVCSPINSFHFFNKKEDELLLILKGQFMGQNGNSPFQRVQHVNNCVKDYIITDENGSILKRNKPILQLLTEYSDYNIRHNMDYVLQNIREQELPTSDKQVMIKPKAQNRYICIDKDKIDQYDISEYYPIITFEQIQNLQKDIPAIEIDMACLGLGSAGSGILDQVGRSIMINSYLLCDYDIVEEKNLRNQFYTTGDLRHSKTGSAKTKLAHMRPGYHIDSQNKIITSNSRFQQANLPYYAFKYVVSGFDSIDARIELLQYVKEGKCKTKYLIDTRYDDLTASVLFIDVENAEQMAYYEKGLAQCKEHFDEIQKKQTIQTFEEFIKELKKQNTFKSSCYETKLHILGEEEADLVCDICDDPEHGCKSDKCLEYWKEAFDKHLPKIQEIYKKEPEESSCVKHNFIDIYKYASSFVFAAIREIENGEAKPFTHIECSTDVIPKSMILKK